MIWDKHLSLFVSKNFPDMGGETFKKLVLFGNEILKWNRSVNLISRKSPDLNLLRLIIEALFLSTILKGNERILDIGAGAGFPSIPILLCIDVEIVMAESKRKRASFLNHIIHLLNLGSAHVLNENVSSSSIQPLGKFDALWAKAALPLEELFQMGKEGLILGGNLILFRSFQGKKERHRLQSLAEDSGFTSPVFKVFRYHNLHLTRTITTCQRN